MLDTVNKNINTPSPCFMPWLCCWKIGWKSERHKLKMLFPSETRS